MRRAVEVEGAGSSVGAAIRGDQGVNVLRPEHDVAGEQHMAEAVWFEDVEGF